MSVHQTRAHFLGKYGTIIDNELIGRDLKEYYWKPGNSVPFLQLIEDLTGKPLTCEAWISRLKKPTKLLIESEKKAYFEALNNGPKYKAGENVDLKMSINLVHGDELIASSADDGLVSACSKFKKWVKEQ